jgi:exoribonuclease R
VLARTEEKGSGFVAHPMKKLLKGSELVLGVVHQEGDALWLRPVDKKERRELPISDVGRAAVGDLVLAEKTGRPPRITARVTDVLGDPFAPRSFSMIAIHKLGIPARVLGGNVAEAVEVSKRPLGEGREDLRHLPIVAIDPVMRATMTTRSGRKRTRRRAGGARSSRSRTSASTCAAGLRWTRKRGSAATASISRTASCRCCRRSSAPTSAR